MIDIENLRKVYEDAKQSNFVSSETCETIREPLTHGRKFLKAAWDNWSELLSEITWFRTAQEAQLKRAEVDQKHILNLENTLQVYRDQNTWQYERIKFLEDAMGGAMITERRERERVKQLTIVLQELGNKAKAANQDGQSSFWSEYVEKIVHDTLLEVDLDKA